MVNSATTMNMLLMIIKDIKGDWKKLGSGSFGNVYKGMFWFYTYMADCS